MIKIKHRGSFKNTERFLTNSQRFNALSILRRYALEGKEVLASATPKDTGLTADSWDYEIKISRTGYTITWINSNSEFGTPVAILLQYGHGVKNGGYVEGIDYINPAIRPIFEKITQSLWEEVYNL